MRLDEIISEDPDIRAIDTVVEFLSHDTTTDEDLAFEPRASLANHLTKLLTTLRKSIVEDLSVAHRDWEGEKADHDIKEAKIERAYE